MGSMRTVILLAALALIVGCSDPADTQALPLGTPSPTVRIVLVGDVMTGRGLSPVIEREADAVFAEVRHLIAAADIAAANLESPLTERPHISPSENQLQADPATAEIVAAAGFDVISLPNNHTTDSGGEGLLDTIAAVRGSGLATVGAGADLATATSPTTITARGVTVGFLAYDATGVSTPAGDGPGVSAWDEDAAIAAVARLRSQADVVVVSVHGGTEYLPSTDPGMAAIAATMADAGADVVWGHGAHVVQPVSVIDGERPAVTATSLGNFLFDQAGTDRTTGYLLEVMVDEQGVVAYRVGISEHPDRRVSFAGWTDPEGDAAHLHGSWWTLVRSPLVVASTVTEVAEFRHGDLTAAAAGDITGDGETDLVASFRRPHRSTPLMETHPEVQWTDAKGRSAHLGVYQPEGLVEAWVAGTVLQPIAGLEICQGSLAVAHNQLDDSAIVAASAWTWNGFGFDTAPDLPGPGTPACADIDGDGITDPVILNR